MIVFLSILFLSIFFNASTMENAAGNDKPFKLLCANGEIICIGSDFIVKSETLSNLVSSTDFNFDEAIDLSTMGVQLSSITRLEKCMTSSLACDAIDEKDLPAVL